MHCAISVQYDLIEESPLADVQFNRTPTKGLVYL